MSIFNRDKSFDTPEETTIREIYDRMTQGFGAVSHTETYAILTLAAVLLKISAVEQGKK